MSKVKHIVLLKFKDGTSEDQIGQLFDSVIDMTESVPGIEDYVAGQSLNDQSSSQGFTHGYVITFEDSGARSAYLSNPEQAKVKSALEPHVDSTLTFDFEI